MKSDGLVRMQVQRKVHARISLEMLDIHNEMKIYTIQEINALN
jgi:hypothetical protein